MQCARSLPAWQSPASEIVCMRALASYWERLSDGCTIGPTTMAWSDRCRAHVCFLTPTKKFHHSPILPSRRHLQADGVAVAVRPASVNGIVPPAPALRVMYARTASADRLNRIRRNPCRRPGVAPQYRYASTRAKVPLCSLCRDVTGIHSNQQAVALGTGRIGQAYLLIVALTEANYTSGLVEQAVAVTKGGVT